MQLPSLSTPTANASFANNSFANSALANQSLLNRSLQGGEGASGSLAGGSAASASESTKLPFELGQPSAEASDESEPVREAFTDFVGQTLFGSMMASMRKSLDKPAYFHGGRAEEVFQEQLDQTLVEEISDASADSFVNPMFDLFQLQRRG
ncbi:Rod binding protein [Neorhodopirellula lusitana]|uniref:Rod binding protein n=1 Tax=Neorhodopirellula lusitana TaxID=445327 RepID=A0ABY1Q9S9_9BACT|nr:rod-binding protein [Neorhodopirellula lusitana]SMP63529.1 Rod binding protein [Neorhodopirellula lusitana]